MDGCDCGYITKLEKKNLWCGGLWWGMWDLGVQILSFHAGWHMYAGDSEQLVCTVKKSSILQLRPSMNVFLASNTTERIPDFTLKGNFLERNLTIFHGQEAIAQVLLVFPFFIFSNILLHVWVLENGHTPDHCAVWAYRLTCLQAYLRQWLGVCPFSNVKYSASPF